jgi:glycosyltransferase involved in cell wall biosynthesis
MNTNKNALITVVTPTLNRAQFLEQNIKSVKGQQYPNIEHLIQDGLSSDNSFEIFEKYKGTYNVSWVSQKDQGCSDALNKAFAMAQGDIFCWLDSDDFYSPRNH